METPLIAILRDHLNATLTAPFDTNWPELLELSKKHEVTAIVYVQCKSFIPKEYLDEFLRASSMVLFYYANRVKLMEKIEATLTDIEHFTIKGASVARFYPFPAFRTMGDTDIVIHTQDREEADKRLRNLGLNCTSSFIDREWQYYYKDMEFELHNHLVYSETVNAVAQEQYFNDFWKHVKGNELDWDFHFLFLIFHLRKHFMNSGVGFRPFVDIAVLCSNGPDLNWTWIKEELKKLDLWAFTERVFFLNEHWFEIKPPLMIDYPPEDFYGSATELILKNGVFGFNNEGNRDNAAVNAIRGQGSNQRAMLKVAAQKLFPGYQTMQPVPHYSYLRGRPYLLPVAWLHRMLRTISRGRVKESMRTVLNTSFTDRETIHRREAVYEQWGL